jgi:hypothetical protein
MTPENGNEPCGDASIQPVKERKSRVRGVVIGLLILGNCVLTAYATYQDRFVDIRRSQEKKLYANIDNVFSVLRRRSDSIFLLFGNFTGRDAGFISTIYFRGVFTAFPAHVLVADPSKPLFFIKQIVEANRLPDNAWLKSHHVGVIVTIRLNNGQLLFTPRWLQGGGSERPSRSFLDAKPGLAPGNL